MADQDWYKINNIEQLDTPALVVYPDRVKENIRMLTGMIDNIDRLRPHVKTHKSREATLLMMEAGILKFKCATIAEAEMLGMCKAPDVLLAYQPFGPKLDRLLKLIKIYPQTIYSCLVDNEASAKSISERAVAHDLQIPVYIDLNVGMNRTGIVPGQEALHLYRYCSELPGLKVLGLHAYDGHIHDAGLDIRTQKANTVLELVEGLQQNIKDSGLPNPVVIIGGSPTFPVYAKRQDVEVSPGTFIYWDRGYGLAFTEQPFLPAALVISRVVSLPGGTKLCLDAGHKSVSAENELNKRIFFLNAPNLVMLSQSEEHLVVDAGEGHPYKTGDVFYGLPYHICPTVSAYERAITIEVQKITGEWKNTARDRKIVV